MKMFRQIYPVSFTAVAGVFVVAGVLAFLDTLRVVAHRHSVSLFDFQSVLYLLIGNGLLRLKQMWRRFAMAIIIVYGIFAGGGLLIYANYYVRNSSPQTSRRHLLLAVIYLFVAEVLCVWIYYVLVRKDVRNLFFKKQCE